jgi:hypothetical protein
VNGALRVKMHDKHAALRCVGQALAPEAIAECIRSGGVWELAAIAIFK